MKIYAETERLILRELLPSDDENMFRLDADPLVHSYLGNKPIKTVEEAQNIIAFVREQYESRGIGRWAAVEKSTGNFIGWTGLKLMKEELNGHNNFYDVGYRLIPEYWGKGYATESAIASVQYGFDVLKADVIYGIADINNKASRRALEKTGLQFVEYFTDKGMELAWYRIDKPS